MIGFAAGDLVMEEISGMIGIVVVGGFHSVKVRFNDNGSALEEGYRWVSVEYLEGMR